MQPLSRYDQGCVSKLTPRCRSIMQTLLSIDEPIASTYSTDMQTSASKRLDRSPCAQPRLRHHQADPRDVCPIVESLQSTRRIKVASVVLKIFPNASPCSVGSAFELIPHRCQYKAGQSGESLLRICKIRFGDTRCSRRPW